MSLAESASELVDSIIEMPGHFVDVATHDPVSAALLAIGALLTFAAVAVLGYLSLGAVLSVLTVENSQARSREVR